jgi:hypothetical protein
MKKKFLLTAFIIVIALTALGLYFFYPKSSDKTDEEIRKMFYCDRDTLDILATDVYCDNPNLYREDVKNNKVIGPDDFNGR